VPAHVDANVSEILTTAEAQGHVLGQVIEVLWGATGTVPTAEAAVHGQTTELLTTAQTLVDVTAQVAEVLWLDLTFEIQVDAQVIEVLWAEAQGAPAAQDAFIYGQVIEILVTAQDEVHVQGQVAEILLGFPPAQAIVNDIAGTVLVPTMFDGTTSTGLIFNHLWSWISVPGGSTIGNSAQPYPDNGAVGIIDMTDNQVLYHAEEAAGTTGIDTSGSLNNATLTAITVGAGSQVGTRAWAFTGSTSKAQPGVSVPVVVGAAEWTLAFWLFNLAANTSYRTGMWGTSESHLLLETGGDRVGVWSGGAFRATDTAFTMPVGSYTGWHHIAAVGTSGGNTRIFVDGFFVGAVIGFRPTENVTTIGNNSANGQRFADRMDEIAIWHRPLSDQEVSDVFTLQEGNYAGVEPTLPFTPDVVGTYTIELTVLDGVDLAVTMDTANAIITLPPGGFPLAYQGDTELTQLLVQGQFVKHWPFPRRGRG
jgi:hypothetical protein